MSATKVAERTSNLTTAYSRPTSSAFAARKTRGGYRAIFALVNQFSMANGAIIGTGIFGRNAYVGLESNRFGSITLGNQYDFMVDSLFSKNNAISRDISGCTAFVMARFNVSRFRTIRPVHSIGIARRVANRSRIPSVQFADGVGIFRWCDVCVWWGSRVGWRGQCGQRRVNYEMGPFGVGAAYTNEIRPRPACRPPACATGASECITTSVS